MSRSRRTTPDQRLALLRRRLQDLSPQAVTADLRLALCDESNFVVEQVAKVVREHALSELIPDLVRAYHRFLNDGAECDRGCRAKLAIVEALLPLDFGEPDFWLAGMQYRQQEPVWNGSIDTATDVRGVCAFGLVRSRLIAPSDLLIALTDLLADSEFVARAHAARAITAAGLPGSVALLRLKASFGDSNSEVLGACFTGLPDFPDQDSVPRRRSRHPLPRSDSVDACSATFFRNSLQRFRKVERRWPVSPVSPGVGSVFRRLDTPIRACRDSGPEFLRFQVWPAIPAYRTLLERPPDMERRYMN